MRNALEEITKTLGETMLIVAVAVFLFLGSVRTAARAAGRDAGLADRRGIVMDALGFSLNLLTIRALVLAVGLVVDDANLPLSATETLQSRATSACRRGGFIAAAAARNRRFICEQSR